MNNTAPNVHRTLRPLPQFPPSGTPSQMNSTAGTSRPPQKPVPQIPPSIRFQEEMKRLEDIEEFISTLKYNGLREHYDIALSANRITEEEYKILIYVLEQKYKLTRKELPNKPQSIFDMERDILYANIRRIPYPMDTKMYGPYRSSVTLDDKVLRKWNRYVKEGMITDDEKTKLRWIEFSPDYMFRLDVDSPIVEKEIEQLYKTNLDNAYVEKRDALKKKWANLQRQNAINLPQLYTLERALSDYSRYGKKINIEDVRNKQREFLRNIIKYRLDLDWIEYDEKKRIEGVREVEEYWKNEEKRKHGSGRCKNHKTQILLHRSKNNKIQTRRSSKKRVRITKKRVRITKKSRKTRTKKHQSRRRSTR